MNQWACQSLYCEALVQFSLFYSYFISPQPHIIGISSLLFRLKKKDSEEEKEGNEEEKDSRDLDPRDLHDTRDFRDPRDLRCFICGDAGHVRRECPEVKLARQRNSSVAGKQKKPKIVSGGNSVIYVDVILRTLILLYSKHNFMISGLLIY